MVTQTAGDASGSHETALAETTEVSSIPAVEWPAFLVRFGRRHRAWLTTVHGVERETPVTRATLVPLESIALERRGDDYLVRVTFAKGLSLCAPRPRAVRVQHTHDGAEWALEVDTADSGFIRLAFRATTLPDQLDGLVPAELNTRPH